MRWLCRIFGHQLRAISANGMDSQCRRCGVIATPFWNHRRRVIRGKETYVTDSKQRPEVHQG